MKRFWAEVTVGDDRGVLLDARPVRTPGRVALAVPTRSLAEAIAEEWRAVGETLAPGTMLLTGLANAAIDRIAPDPGRFAADLGRYAETDMLLYRADGPAPLVARQHAAWDPPLAWARSRYDIALEPTTGIVHRAQAPATLARLHEATAAFSPFVLAPLSPIVTISGSLILGLMLAEQAITPDALWNAAHVDEDWQIEQWGEDSLAADARAGRRREFEAAVRFLTLLR